MGQEEAALIVSAADQPDARVPRIAAPAIQPFLRATEFVARETAGPAVRSSLWYTTQRPAAATTHFAASGIAAERFATVASLAEPVEPEWAASVAWSRPHPPPRRSSSLPQLALPQLDCW